MVVDAERRAGAGSHGPGTADVVGMSVGNEDPIDVGGRLADGGQPGDDPAGGTPEAGVDQGHGPCRVDDGEGIDEIARRGDPPETGRELDGRGGHGGHGDTLGRRAPRSAPARPGFPGGNIADDREAGPERPERTLRSPRGRA